MPEFGQAFSCKPTDKMVAAESLPCLVSGVCDSNLMRTLRH